MTRPIEPATAPPAPPMPGPQFGKRDKLGRRNRGGKKPPSEVERRRKVIWTLVMKGIPDWQINEQIVEAYGCSERTVRRDFEALATRVREALGDGEHVDRQVGACIERLVCLHMRFLVGAPAGIPMQDISLQAYHARRAMYATCRHQQIFVAGNRSSLLAGRGP